MGGMSVTPRARIAPLLLAAVITAAGCDGAGPDEPAAPPAPLPAALPSTGHTYRLLRARGPAKGAPLEAVDLAAELASSDAVCLGEQHDSADDHAAQLLLLDRLIARAAPTHARLGLGLEMFQRLFQPVLDDYSAGAIDEPTMLARTQWMRYWSIDYAFYRPLLTGTVAAGGSIRGLNAREDLAQKVARSGLSALTVDERAELPELDLDSAEHRAWFERTVMGISAHGPSAVTNLYAAQVVRDETMADTAWQWLKAQGPGPRQIAIIAGDGHCMDLAIPARMRRRGAGKVLIVQPVLDRDREVQAALAEGFSDILVAVSR